MDKIIVLGGGGHGKVVIALLQGIGSFEPAGYVDREDKGDILGVPYAGNDDCLPALFSRGIRRAAVGIGNVGDDSLRRRVIAQALEEGFSFPALVSPAAVVDGSVTVGGGTVVMPGVVIQPGTRLGRFVIVNTRASVDHDCDIGDYVHIAPGVTLCGSVTVGEGALIGAGATVIHQRRIAASAVIGAGAVVTSDCAREGLYLGTPARLSNG